MAGKAVTQNKAAASVPRKTVIKDQPHMLAYITPYEAEILMAHGGAGKPGPGGIPSYFFGGYDSFGDMFDGGGPGKSGDTYGNDAAQSAAADSNNDGRVSAAEAAAVGGLKGGIDGNSDKGFLGGILGGLTGGTPTSTPSVSSGEGGKDYKLPTTATDSAAVTDTPADTNLDNVKAATERMKAILEAAGIELSTANLEAMAADPEAFLAERGIKLADLNIKLDGDATGTSLDPNNPSYKLGGDFAYSAATPDASIVSGVPTAGDAPVVDTATASDKVMGENYTVNAATGTVRDENLVNADGFTIDMTGAATGVNADGTRNLVGEALNDFASQSFSTIIDTSTVAGKLLANKMGEGNYLDSKATILGQMKILSDEFKDGNGDPAIPVWAQSTARELSRTIAFKGITGTAALAATSNAMMEATIGISEKEAAFFQTTTLQNLENRQTAIINKATVLSKFEVSNLEARSAAAVQNAKTFLEMDLTNLANEQQSEVLNKQARVDALFNDVAEMNVNRRFNITNEIENRQFYDNLSTTVAMHNSSEINAMKSANANRADAAAQWAAETELTRAKWESEMAYNIDVSNATWRRTVEAENTKLEFEAASIDVKNALGLTTETLNRIWDRVDAQLDYIWRSTEADEQRDYDLLIAELQAQGAAAEAKAKSKGSLFGSILSAGATIIASDIRLKEDIRLFDTLPNGVKIYTWKWNEEGRRIGVDKHPGFGVIAQEIQETHPEAVVLGEHGYLMVNYEKVTK